MGKKNRELNISSNILVIEPRESRAKDWKRKIEKLGCKCKVVAGRDRANNFVNHKGEHIKVDVTIFQLVLVGMVPKKHLHMLLSTPELAKWCTEEELASAGIFHHLAHSHIFKRVIQSRGDLTPELLEELLLPPKHKRTTLSSPTIASEEPETDLKSAATTYLATLGFSPPPESLVSVVSSFLQTEPDELHKQRD